jgi:hypothetical protein
LVDPSIEGPLPPSLAWEVPLLKAEPQRLPGWHWRFYLDPPARRNYGDKACHLQREKREDANRTMMWRCVIRPLAVAALAALTACAAPEVRPELAVITSPIDDVWVAFVEVAKESGFELESLDLSKHVIKAVKDSTFVVGGSTDPYVRFGRATRIQHHSLMVSMRPRGDQSTAIEIAYSIDKVPDEEASFALLTAVRERLALQAR